MAEQKTRRKGGETSVLKARTPKPGAGSDVEREELAELRKQAFELRLAGHSQKAIGDMLGRDHSTISRWIQVEIENMIVPRVEALREQESARLDLLLTKLEPKIARGDVNAINAAVRISERRSRLMGLDAPVKVEHRNITVDAIDAEIVRLSALLGQTPEQALAELEGEVVAEASEMALPWSPPSSDPLAGIDTTLAPPSVPAASEEATATPSDSSGWDGPDPWEVA